MLVSDAPIIISQSFNVSPQQLWKSITEQPLMVQWFFENIPEFNPEVGFETRFDVQVEDRLYPHLWKILQVDPGKRITYDWRYGGYPGKATVEFRIRELEGGSELQICHTALESFPQDMPELTREAGVQGWTYFIQQRLKEFLSATPN